MGIRRILIALNALLIALLSCNLGAGQSTAQPDLAATITAQALALEVLNATPAPLVAATPGSAGTAAVPQVSVTSVTNCRTGPSTAFNLIFTMNPGQSADVVGKNTPTSYWIINAPSGGTCWLWGKFAVVNGATSGLPEVPAPTAPVTKSTKTPKPTSAATSSSAPSSTPAATATSAPTAPSAPSGFNQTRDCAGGYRGVTPIWIETIKLTWQDNADNETGYRVYKNDSAVPDLPANTTEYNIILRYDQGTGGSLYDNFGLEAFNDVGASSRSSVDVPRCP